MYVYIIIMARTVRQNPMEIVTSLCLRSTKLCASPQLIYEQVIKSTALDSPVDASYESESPLVMGAKPSFLLIPFRSRGSAD